jgi:myxalamid-type polyketide synthase MxaE and MxaD
MERWPLYRLSRRWVAANNCSGSCQGLYALLAGESNAAREFGETLTTLLGHQGAHVVTLDCLAGSEVAASTLRAAFGGQAGIVIDCRALWPVTDHPTRAARMVYQRGLDLLQAVAQVDPDVGVCMLTRGALPVAGADAIELQNTVLPGLLRTAAAEDPSRPILIADLDPGQPPAPECVVDLLKIASVSQPEVAWRGRQAYTPTLVPVGAGTSNRGQPTSASLPPIRGDGTYLVSGGLGGIGLRVAAWLAARGAGGVVLLGRQPATAFQVEAVERLCGAGGCRIVCLSCDVSDLESLVALRGDALATLPPIRGVLHAAGVLADASLPNQDGARFETVARAKLDGSWCLHEFTKDDPVELMVFFSSVSAAFGAPGQANYAAANGFMDGLAAWRHANGQPALSVAWGPWATDGMAARLSPAQQARMKSYGMGFLESAAALEAMASIPNNESVVAVLEMAAERLMGQARPGLAGLLRGLKSTAGQSAGVAAAPEAPAPVAPTAAHPGTQGDALILEIARALGFEPATLELDAPLSDLGLDSMMAIQLRGSFAKKCGVDLPLRLLLEGVSTRALVAQCNERESDGPVTTAIPDETASTAEVALDEGML